MLTTRGSRLFILAAGMLLALACSGQAFADPPAGASIDVAVNGETRTALVFAPATAKEKPAPLIFVFHGHGGTSAGAAAQYDYQTLWPEAVVVYPQGVPTVSNTDAAGAKAGWQHKPGDLEDRDLKFFDASLAQIRKAYRVDDRRIYATGQSNGGGFTYLLWAARGDTFAAVAPSSASNALEFVKDLKPKPALHIAGEKDQTAPFAKQRTLMDALRQLNGCDAKGTPWQGKGVMFASPTGTPFVEITHPGGHPLPDWGPKLIVEFFKSQTKPG